MQYGNILSVVVRTTCALVLLPVFFGCSAGRTQKSHVPSNPPKVAAIPVIAKGTDLNGFRRSLFEKIQGTFPRLQGSQANWSLRVEGEGGLDDLVYSYANLAESLPISLRQLCDATAGNLMVDTPRRKFAKERAAEDVTENNSNDLYHFWWQSVGNFSARCVVSNVKDEAFVADFQTITKYSNSLGGTVSDGVVFHMKTQSEISAEREAKERSQALEAKQQAERRRLAEQEVAERRNRIKAAFAYRKKGSQDMCLSEFEFREFTPRTALKCQTFGGSIELGELQAHGWIAIDIQTRSVEKSNALFSQQGFQYQVRIQKER